MADEKVMENTPVYDDAAIEAEYLENRPSARLRSRLTAPSPLIPTASWKSGTCVSVSR